MTTVTPPFTGSYAVGLQGINVSRFDLFGLSIAPKMGMNGVTTYLSGAAGTLNSGLIIDVSPDSRAFFDDSLRLPKRVVATSSGSLGAVSGSLVEIISGDDFRVQQVPRYRLSRQTFGIEKDVDSAKPFVEMNSFDPVVYLDNQTQLAWPLVFDVPNSIDPFDFDGAIEPFTLRKTIAGNSTFTGTPDDPEPTGIRGGVSSGQLIMNTTGRAVECSNFYKYENSKPEFFDEGMDLEAEDTALAAAVLPATGSISVISTTFSSDPDWASGLSLKFATAGATFNATTDSAVTMGNSTAVKIGISGVTTQEDLTTSIFNSITQAIKFGAGSTIKDTRTDLSANLNLLWPSTISSGKEIAMTSSLVYESPRMKITGSLVSGSLDGNERLHVKGMGGSSTSVYGIDIPAISEYNASTLAYLDKDPVESIFKNISNSEIRLMLVSSMSATGRRDLPTGYPSIESRSKPCGFEYENSMGIDSIVYGGLLK